MEHSVVWHWNEDSEDRRSEKIRGNWEVNTVENWDDAKVGVKVRYKKMDDKLTLDETGVSAQDVLDGMVEWHEKDRKGDVQDSGFI